MMMICLLLRWLFSKEPQPRTPPRESPEELRARWHAEELLFKAQYEARDRARRIAGVRDSYGRGPFNHEDAEWWAEKAGSPGVCTISRQRWGGAEEEETFVACKWNVLVVSVIEPRGVAFVHVSHPLIDMYEWYMGSDNVDGLFVGWWDKSSSSIIDGEWYKFHLDSVNLRFFAFETV